MPVATKRKTTPKAKANGLRPKHLQQIGGIDVVMPSTKTTFAYEPTPLAQSFLSDLADKFDPPEWQAIAAEDDVFDPPDIVDWAHNNFVDPVEGKLIKLQPIQQKILRAIFKLVWEHKVTTVVYSAIKKSGKTTIAGLVGAYWAANIEAPNEIITIANDQEQAKGRIFDALVPTMKRLGWNVPPVAPIMRDPVTRSVIKAIGTNYAGEAGGNYGLTLWSELWAYKSEDRQRLWEEMTPVPTRKYSIRWVETYAGFKGQSKLLWKLYTMAFEDGDESKPKGKKLPGLENLPIWYMEDKGAIVYWEHLPRMPWQTPKYYDQQRAENRPNAFKRLHQNEWVSSEDTFITPDQWDGLGKCQPLNWDGDTRSLVIGVDGSVSGAHTALVCATWNTETQAPDIVKTLIWKPHTEEWSPEKKTMDLVGTVGEALEYLLGSDDFDVQAIYYDQYQLHAVMTELKKKYDRHDTKKLFVNFPQSNGRIQSDQYFYEIIREKRLRHTGDPDLREHVLNAIVDETTRGFRLSVDKGTKDDEGNQIVNDAAVAAAMATFGSSIRNKAKRKFIRV
jgi:phage terminase large subunit-like protein